MRTINDNVMLDSEYVTVLENVGKINPMNISEYTENHGYEALKKALKEMSPNDVIESVKKSGLRGRGGAGFPTGLKWSITAPLKGEKFVLCNADEGEPGTFKDRLVMDWDPHKLIERMNLAGYALRAKRAEGLYKEDAEMLAHRKSHENEQVKELYREFLEEPYSEKAHHLLHTNYVKRSRY